jgi:hypothetical protein
MLARWGLLTVLLLGACSDDKLPADAAGDPADAAPSADAAPPADALPPPDSTPAPDAYQGDGMALVCGSKALYESCTDGIECDSCLCFTEGERSYCSKSCTSPADCPAPSQGCNLLDVCRPPPP